MVRSQIVRRSSHPRLNHSPVPLLCLSVLTSVKWESCLPVLRGRLEEMMDMKPLAPCLAHSGCTLWPLFSLPAALCPSLGMSPAPKLTIPGPATVCPRWTLRSCHLLWGQILGPSAPWVYPCTTYPFSLCQGGLGPSMHLRLPGVKCPQLQASSLRRPSPGWPSESLWPSKREPQLPQSHSPHPCLSFAPTKALMLLAW